MPRGSRKSSISPIASSRWAPGSRAGTPRITIEGVSRLNGARHTVLPDRIETGTYAMAAAMVGGDVTLENTRADLLHSALDVLTTTGAEITSTADTIRIRRNGGGIAAVDVTTDPFPGFPHRPSRRSSWR